MTMINRDIALAKKLLEKGKVVAIPTETVYGLAGNALDEEAIDSIYRVKERPKSNPLIIHIASIDQLDSYAQNIPPLAYHLGKEFWPGPLTLLLEKKPIIPEATTSGSPFVAVRIPDHPLTLALLESIDFPLAAPSANPFGYISPTRPEHVQEQIGDKIPLILDGAPCKSGLESTIVGFEDQKLNLHRQGYITEEQLKAFLPKNWCLIRKQDTTIRTPGSHDYHYAPYTPMTLVDDFAEIDPSVIDSKTGSLSWNKMLPGAGVCRVLSKGNSLEEAAKLLYNTLIELDQMALEQIYCERFPQQGLGITINERLEKAAKRARKQ